MAKDYISSKDANSNFLAVLANKGKQGESSPSRFTLSPKTMASAKKAYDAQMEDAFQDATGVTFGVGVCIDPNQIPCRFFKYEDMEAHYSYSGKWLDLYTDNATILNNFAYVFDFVDRHWNMSIAKPGREESFFINHVVVHYRNEFATGTAYQLEDMKQMGVLASYNSLLKRHGASIESAITWFFNEYIADEYGIRGFRIDLPALDAAPLSKCKDIGPEIERVLITFSMLERDGTIDRDQYSYESFTGFKAIGSLLKKPKYAYGSGEEFEGISNALFSSQTTLSYCRSVNESHDCFFDYLVKHEMMRSHYDDGQLKAIDYLIDKGFLRCDEESDRLVPTLGAIILKRLWTDGVISYCELHSGEKVLVDSLIDDGFLETESTLFNRLEADYLSYMFDDREFANALAIRNRYSHSPDISTLPNDNQHEANYLHFLQLLVVIVLKINYELFYAFGNGGAGVEFVDWELDDIDEATVRMLSDHH